MALTAPAAHVTEARTVPLLRAPWAWFVFSAQSPVCRAGGAGAHDAHTQCSGAPPSADLRSLVGFRLGGAIFSEAQGRNVARQLASFTASEREHEGHEDATTRV